MRHDLSFLRVLAGLWAAGGLSVLGAGVPPGHSLPVTPLWFEPQAAQAKAETGFVARAGGYQIQLHSTQAWLRTAHSSLRLQLAGSQPATAVPRDRQPAHTNYAFGPDPAQWRTRVPHFGAVAYQGVYPGVDVVYHARGRRLEYDFVIAPGARPEQIRLQFPDAARLRIDRDGTLWIDSPQGQFRQQAPDCYQDHDGQRRQVAGRFVRRGQNEVGFALGEYDRRRTLVIDPVLSYSTYQGDSLDEYYRDVAVDATGSMYVAGFVSNPQSSPATTNAFVTRYSAAGALLWTTYVGGSTISRARAIAVDSLGAPYVTGNAGPGMATTPGAYLRFTPQSGDGFLAKLNPADGSLTYSTYLFGQSGADVYDLAVDAQGRAFLAGAAWSTTFPVTGGTVQATRRGTNSDGFVMAMNALGTGVVFTTLLGGEDYSSISSIALDGQGRPVVAGTVTRLTTEPAKPFLITNASYQWPSTPALGNDAFVAGLSADGGSLLFASRLGGTQNDEATSVGVDAAGNVFVAGSTASTDWPVSAAAYRSAPGSAFLMKLQPQAAGLVYSTYLGSLTNLSQCQSGFPSYTVNPYNPPNPVPLYAGCGSVNSMAVDSAGRATVLLTTPAADLPATAGALQAAHSSANGDLFLMQLDATGTVNRYATYWGGTAPFLPAVGQPVLTWNVGTGVAVDPQGNFYLAGMTNSLRLPLTANAAQTLYKGGYEGLLAKIDMTTDTTGCLPKVTPASLSVPVDNGTATLQLTLPAGCPWVLSSNSPWLSVTSPVTGTGSTTISVAYGGMAPLVQPRTGALLVAGTVVGVVQGDNACSFGLSHTYQGVATGGLPSTSGVAQVAVGGPAGCPWKPSTDASWIHLVATGLGNGNGGFSYTFDANPTLSPRTGVIDVGGARISVVQQGRLNGHNAAVYRGNAGGLWTLDAIGAGSGFTQYQFGFGGTQAIAGDWNGSGTSKLGVFNPSNGQWLVDVNGNGLWNGNGIDLASQFGVAGDLPVSGDWTGDGKTKLGVYRPSVGVFYLDLNGSGIWNGEGVDQSLALVSPQAGDVPVVGDWTGDGKAKVGLFRAGTWYLWTGTQVRSVQFGFGGAIPVVGDWNGSGTAKVGVFDPASGIWYVDYNGDGFWNGAGIDRALQFGFAGVTPVVGDWNGDGRTKVGVFYNGTWYFDLNGNYVWEGAGVDRALALGQAGDQPVVGKWQ